MRRKVRVHAQGGLYHVYNRIGQGRSTGTIVYQASI